MQFVSRQNTSCNKISAYFTNNQAISKHFFFVFAEILFLLMQYGRKYT